MRAPLAPIGWPRATAPPLTLTFSGLSLSWRVTAMAATAKASLSSTRSTSLSRSHSDRMAESDGAAIDVNFFGIELELARDGDGGNREGFVEFNEVYIFIAVPLRSDGRERRRRH